MGTRYIVSVVKIEDVENAENRYDTRDTTLFEATHVDAERLAQFAPIEVMAALRPDGVPSAVAGEAARPKLATETVPAALVETAAGSADTEQEKPKRSRRTKAQIEADKAAAAASGQGVQHMASATGADPSPENQATLGSMMSAPAAVDELNTTAPAAAPWPQAPALTTPPAPAAPEAPFNPFQ